MIKLFPCFYSTLLVHLHYGKPASLYSLRSLILVSNVFVDLFYNSYMQLSSQLSKHRPIYALDDKVVESGIDLPFQSIEQVATNCIAIICSILSHRIQSNNYVEIHLAGWSYGGVVAVEVAKQFAANACIKVKSVAMFDSPLRSAVVLRENTQNDRSPFDTTSDGNAKSNVVTLQRAAKHFKECTQLLSLYHQRPKETKPLSCAILDVRPKQSDYIFDEEPIAELTSGPILKEIVPGTHWTMLYDGNASSTAGVLEKFWV